MSDSNSSIALDGSLLVSSARLGVWTGHTNVVELIVHNPVDAEVVVLGGRFCRPVFGRETH